MLEPLVLKNGNSFARPNRPKNKDRFFSRIEIDLSDGFEKRFRFRPKSRRIALIVSNDLHREFLWDVANKHFQLPLRDRVRGVRKSDRAPRREAVERDRRPIPQGYQRPSTRPKRRSSPACGASGGRLPRCRRAKDDHETTGKLFRGRPAVDCGRARLPQRVVRNTRPTSVPVKTNRGKDENRRTGKSPFQSLGDSRERPRAILLDCPSKPRRESRSFSEEKRTCGVFATLFCLKFTGRMRFEAETCYYSTRMVRVLYPRTPPWWSYDPGVAAFCETPSGRSGSRPNRGTLLTVCLSLTKRLRKGFKAAATFDPTAPKRLTDRRRVRSLTGRTGRGETVARTQ